VRGNSSSSFTSGSYGGSMGGIASGTPRVGRGVSNQRLNTNTSMTPTGEFSRLSVSSQTWSGTPLNDGRYMGSSSSSSGVVSGGRNVPLSLSFSSNAGDGTEEGMFIQRTEEEQVIEQVTPPSPLSPSPIRLLTPR
jgi:hypothetical protein